MFIVDFFWSIYSRFRFGVFIVEFFFVSRFGWIYRGLEWSFFASKSEVLLKVFEYFLGFSIPLKPEVISVNIFFCFCYCYYVIALIGSSY